MLSRIGVGGCCVTHSSIRGLAPQAGGFRRHPSKVTGSWPSVLIGCLPRGQRVSYQFTCFPYHTPIRDRLPDPFHKILANHITSKNHVDQNAALEPLLYRGKGYVVLYLNVMEVATGKSFFILIPNSNYIPPLDCLVAESPHFTTLSELNNYVWSVDRKFIIEELEHSFYDSKKYLPMRQFHEMELELKLNLQRPMWPHKESARSAPKGVQWFHDWK